MPSDIALYYPFTCRVIKVLVLQIEPNQKGDISTMGSEAHLLLIPMCVSQLISRLTSHHSPNLIARKVYYSSGTARGASRCLESHHYYILFALMPHDPMARHCGHRQKQSREFSIFSLTKPSIRVGKQRSQAASSACRQQAGLQSS